MNQMLSNQTEAVPGVAGEESAVRGVSSPRGAEPQSDGSTLSPNLPRTYLPRAAANTP